MSETSPSETPRYKVTKEAGSRWAHVIDTWNGFSTGRFNVLKADGWAQADRYCQRLNKAAPNR